ncbi:hypothetical protein [Tolypothrix bouteillei]|uniref:hypothetical protein n=1 Tax=Tolypothrix bouteillei TaxID=1246981 RepID=UPI0038B4266A
MGFNGSDRPTYPPELKQRGTVLFLPLSISKGRVEYRLSSCAISWVAFVATTDCAGISERLAKTRVCPVFVHLTMGNSSSASTSSLNNYLLVQLQSRLYKSI